MSLPDDKAILGDEVITDGGDTRCPNKFIYAQAEIVGPAADGELQKGFQILVASSRRYRMVSRNS
jgi:hypothetical protein